MASHLSKIYFMYYVYVLRSKTSRTKTYVGMTVHLGRRLIEHNLGKEVHTSKYVPWVIESYIAVKDRKTAFELERYLKSASGKAFLNKRLLSRELVALAAAK